MNKEVLLEKRIVAEQRFNELQEELNRLQGEHRAYTSLLNELEKTTETAPASDPVQTIEVKEESTEDATKSE